MTHDDFMVDTYGLQHLNDVKMLMNQMITLHRDKESKYKGSWAKRGFAGAFFTYARPWDRIAGVFEPTVATNYKDMVVSRWFFDALIDLALYLIKMAVCVAAIDSDIYMGWQEEHFGAAEPFPLVDLGRLKEVEEEEIPF